MNYLIRVVGPAGLVRYLRLVETDDVNEATKFAIEEDATDIAYIHGEILWRRKENVIVDVVPAECE